jgi:hypothetical protein
MTPQTLDNIAIGLCAGAILMRLIDRPWWSSLLGTVSLLFSVVAQTVSRRRDRVRFRV